MGFSCVNLSLNLDDLAQRRTKKGCDGFVKRQFSEFASEPRGVLRSEANGA